MFLLCSATTPLPLLFIMYTTSLSHLVEFSSSWSPSRHIHVRQPTLLWYYNYYIICLGAFLTSIAQLLNVVRLYINLSMDAAKPRCTRIIIESIIRVLLCYECHGAYYIPFKVLYEPWSVGQEAVPDICPDDASWLTDLNGRRFSAEKIPVEQSRLHLQWQATASRRSHQIGKLGSQTFSTNWSL